MIRSSQKKIDWLLCYQCILAVAAVFTFYSNLDIYLYNAVHTPSPLILVLLFGLASTPLIFSIFSRIIYFPLPLLIWCAGYISISFISFFLFLSSAAAYQEVRNRILAVIFLLLMLLIFSRYHIVQLWARRAVFVTVLMTIGNNIYEFFNPLAFGLLNDSGRPAGFYIDPNQTGYALLVGMIFSVGILRQKYRVPFVAITGIGIFSTFSRGAMLSWFVVMVIFIITSVIPRSQLLYWLVGLGIILIFAGSAFETVLNLDRLQELGLVNDNIRRRLEWAEKPSDSEDSAASRLEVAKLGWQLFTEHPLWGNGIGSTLDWNVAFSTHNMYIYYMADHGILGAFIMPLLICALTVGARGESKYIGLALAADVLLWCLFSHTVSRDRYTLIMFALMAAMNMTSQLEQKYQIGHKS